MPYLDGLTFRFFTIKWLRRLIAGCDAGPGPDLHGVGFGLGTLAVGVVAAVATLAARRHPQADQHEPVAGSKAA
jgi:hypothetical protein